MAYSLPYTIPNPILHNDPDFKVDREKTHFSYKGRKLANKRSFQFVCRCGEICTTTPNYLYAKLHPFLCRSCSSIECWKDPSYRNPRESHLKKMGSTEENKERGRAHFQRLWSDKAWRESMLLKLHNEKTWKKQSETVRAKLLEDEHFRNELFHRARKNGWGEHCDYQRTNGDVIHLRSRGEKRFASLLDKNGVKWEYEKKGFKLFETNELYYPDFYIEEWDVWVEVKYLLREKDLRKFRVLEKQSPDIRLLAIGHNNINFLEGKCESQELKQAVLSLFETSRSTRITTS
jgi:hypothetical protein